MASRVKTAERMWRRGSSTLVYIFLILCCCCCLAPASSSLVVAPFTAAIILEHDILVDCISHNTSSASSSSSPPPPPPPPSWSTASGTAVTTSASSLLRQLDRRQNNACPSNYSPCAAPAPGVVCCSAGTECQRDQAGNIACCPRGAACTGIISVGTQTGTATTGGNVNSGGFIIGGAGVGGGTTTSSLASTAPTTGFFAPSTTSSALISGQATGTPVGGPGAGYLGFLPIVTPFPNQQVCSSAYSSCQTEFQRCTAALGGLGSAGLTGGFNGITISAAPGIGITVNGASTTLGIAQATSVCQSLSSLACQGLQLVNCNVGSSTPVRTGNAARPTPWLGMGLGCVMLGVVEQVL